MTDLRKMTVEELRQAAYERPESGVPSWDGAFDELARRLAAAEKDAERYRWLRHGDNDEKVIQIPKKFEGLVYMERNETLDAIIDAAIRALKDQKP